MSAQPLHRPARARATARQDGNRHRPTLTLSVTQRGSVSAADTAMATRARSNGEHAVGGSELSRPALMARWRAAAAQLKRWGAQVDPVRLVEDILEDIEAVFDAETNDLLNLTEAAEESGYSADHLGRLLRDGIILNRGRKNAPRIRRADLPRKRVAPLRSPSRANSFVGATPRQIARAVVTSDREEPR